MNKRFQVNFCKFLGINRKIYLFTPVKYNTVLCDLEGKDLGLSISKISSISNRSYLMTKDELNNAKFRGEEVEAAPQESVVPQEVEQPIVETVETPQDIETLKETIEKKISEPKPERRRDIYSEMPIRLLGYTNELGEAIRPISPLLANLSWLPAIAYISADVTDKYKQDEYSRQDKSKGRASKQLVTQLLASVILPTFAVKVGQAIADKTAILSKKGLSLSSREKISNVVINSMKSGEHKNFLDETGKVDKEAYKNALNTKFEEILKHRKTHKSYLKPLEVVTDFLSKPFKGKSANEKVRNYASEIVDRMVDEREQLLDGVRPKNLSKRAFKKIEKLTNNISLEEKQSVVFDTVRKMEKGRMFNNRIIKSLGGLAMLSLMVRPIDNFVEHFIIHKFVSPQIDNISQLYYKQMEARKTAKANIKE